jgi:hypothetical protein
LVQQYVQPFYAAALASSRRPLLFHMIRPTSKYSTECIPEVSGYSFLSLVPSSSGFLHVSHLCNSLNRHRKGNKKQCGADRNYLIRSLHTPITIGAMFAGHPGRQVTVVYSEVCIISTYKQGMWCSMESSESHTHHGFWASHQRCGHNFAPLILDSQPNTVLGSIVIDMQHSRQGRTVKNLQTFRCFRFRHRFCSFHHTTEQG